MGLISKNNSAVKEDKNRHCFFCGEYAKYGVFWWNGANVCICDTCIKDGQIGALLGDGVSDVLLCKGLFPSENADYGLLQIFMKEVLAKTELCFWRSMFWNFWKNHKECKR